MLLAVVVCFDKDQHIGVSQTVADLWKHFAEIAGGRWKLGSPTIADCRRSLYVLMETSLYVLPFKVLFKVLVTLGLTNIYLE